jgi:hypothetical protein
MVQSDIAERNHQVTLMSIIYSKAITVFAWIGPESPELTMDTTVFTTSTRLTNGRPSQSLLRVLFDVVSRDYWKRLWVIQELTLARKARIWYGRQSATKGQLWVKVDSAKRGGWLDMLSLDDPIYGDGQRQSMALTRAAYADSLEICRAMLEVRLLSRGLGYNSM